MKSMLLAATALLAMPAIAQTAPQDGGGMGNNGSAMPMQTPPTDSSMPSGGGNMPDGAMPTGGRQGGPGGRQGGGRGGRQGGGAGGQPGGMGGMPGGGMDNGGQQGGGMSSGSSMPMGSSGMTMGPMVSNPAPAAQESYPVCSKTVMDGCRERNSKK